MPQLIRHIDQIARALQRDVLFVSFESADSDENHMGLPAPNHFYSDYTNDFYRGAFLAFLREHGIAHEPVGHFASESGWMAYAGNIYVDVPWDETNEQFRIVRDYLEDSSGQPLNPLVKFWCCTLDQAMKNAHHDEPGFWERWAENF